MSETKTRGSYKCGKCGETGHNARRCGLTTPTAPKTAKTTSTTSTGQAPAPVDAPTPVAVGVTEADEEPAKPAAVKAAAQVSPQVALSRTQDLTSDHRRPETRPARPAAPFECPSCSRVGILVLLQLEDGRKQLRCEHCYTKARATQILKWGALPEEKPADATKRDSSTRSFF
jgi:hypothetical protein